VFPACAGDPFGLFARKHPRYLLEAPPPSPDLVGKLSNVLSDAQITKLKVLLEPPRGGFAGPPGGATGAGTSNGTTNNATK